MDAGCLGADEMWALDHHFVGRGRFDGDGRSRSPAGRLVYLSKYLSDEDRLRALHRMTLAAISCVPQSALMRRATVVVTLPCSAGNARTLTGIARGVSKGLEIPVLSESLYWNRPIGKVKNLPSAQRAQLVAGALSFGATLAGVVVIVDDIVDTGATMSEAVRVVRRAGAGAVVCFAATSVR